MIGAHARSAMVEVVPCETSARSSNPPRECAEDKTQGAGALAPGSAPAGASGECVCEHAHDVQRFARGTVGDLVAATGAVGDDERAFVRAAHRR